MPAMQLQHGNFSWVDLPASDVTGALAFYQALFDWVCHQDPTLGGYRFLRKGPANVAGMVPVPPAAQQTPAWISYILVDDLEATMARCGELGGSALMAPREAGASGVMCLIQDPSGGVVGLWEARQFTGAELFREHGTVAWNELVSTDAPRARDFFRDLLGWEWRDTGLPDGSVYHVAHVDGRPAAGLMQMTDQWPAGTPSYWEVYFAVDDVDESHDRALELGARAYLEPTDIPVGRISTLRDPQGAAFTLFRPDPTTFQG